MKERVPVELSAIDRQACADADRFVEWLLPRLTGLSLADRRRLVAVMRRGAKEAIRECRANGDTWDVIAAKADCTSWQVKWAALFGRVPLKGR